MSEIRVVVAKAHEEQSGDPDIQREINDVQRFFDKNEFDFDKETLYFVILQGLNRKIERKLNLAGVFVNKTGRQIQGFRARMQLQANNEEHVRIAEVALEIDQNFLGHLNPDEAVILHLDIPAEGLDPAKEIYTATELSGRLEDLELLIPDS